MGDRPSKAELFVQTVLFKFKFVNQHRWTILFTIIATPLGCLIGSTATADLLASESGWARLDVPNQRPAVFEFGMAGERPGGIIVRTDKSVAFLFRPVESLKRGKPKFLSWRWRQEQDFPHTNLAEKGKDDRPLAVHLWFSDPDKPSVFGALGWLFGFPHITHTITYTLGGQHPAGAVLTNPYYDNGALIALRGESVRTGIWYFEIRDVQWDIDTFFPSMPLMKNLKYIAVSADTDDTGGKSVARIMDLRFSDAEKD